MKKKNEFSSGLGFILATAGSSVGLGNLWSFPHKTSQNGGAAFVFAYIISVIMVIYFVFFKDKDTGSNKNESKDELVLADNVKE